MAPSATTDRQWDHEFNSLRRQHLFSNPPKDHSAYPALQAAVDPHINSFNRLFADGDFVRRLSHHKRGLISHAIEDIGTKTFLDGKPDHDLRQRNKLAVRVKSVNLLRPVLPASNKWAKKREVYPAEARETHTSYKGRLSATFEYSINGGDVKEFVRELGSLPVMVKVCLSFVWPLWPCFHLCVLSAEHLQN